MWLRWGLRVVVIAALAGILFALWWFTPPREILQYEKGAPHAWAKLNRAEGEGAQPAVHLRPAFSPLSSISVDLQLAVLAGEDIGFFQHGPWDPGAIREALADWWQRGERLRGASTISQQLAKNLFLNEERSPWRKLREARYAYWLEDKLGKWRCLELYLNIVELGDGLFGVEAAARHYFGVSAAALGDDQAAALAASIPAPLRHNPETRSPAWRARYERILARLSQYQNVRAHLARAR
jgi:monofunctional glycosyltransferase